MIILFFTQSGYSILLTCVAVIITGSFLVYLIEKKFLIRSIKWSDCMKLTESVLRVLFATPIPSLPRSFRSRIVLGFWIFGAIFITAHIQTHFIALLTKPGNEKEISTQDELLTSGLNVSAGFV